MQTGEDQTYQGAEYFRMDANTGKVIMQPPPPLPAAAASISRRNSTGILLLGMVIISIGMGFIMLVAPWCYCCTSSEANSCVQRIDAKSASAIESSSYFMMATAGIPAISMWRFHRFGELSFRKLFVTVVLCWGLFTIMFLGLSIGKILGWECPTALPNKQYGLAFIMSTSLWVFTVLTLLVLWVKDYCCCRRRSFVNPFILHSSPFH